MNSLCYNCQYGEYLKDCQNVQLLFSAYCLKPLSKIMISYFELDHSSFPYETYIHDAPYCCFTYKETSPIYPRLQGRHKCHSCCTFHPVTVNYRQCRSPDEGETTFVNCKHCRMRTVFFFQPPYVFWKGNYICLEHED